MGIRRVVRFDLPGFAFAGKGGVRVEIKVIPNASRNHIALKDDQLRAWVTVPPEKGKANKAVIKLVAKAWALPKTSLSVTTGATSRNKSLNIEQDTETVARKLRAWVAEQEG